MAVLTAQLRREALLGLRSRAEAANPLAFYLLGTLLLGIGLGEAAASPGMIWALTLFAAMLAGAELFRREHDDGTLELLILHAEPRYPAMLAKLAVHWLGVGLPLGLAGPLAFLLLGGERGDAGNLAAALLLGLPAVCCVSALGAALTAGIGGRGLLLAILVLPLYLPAFIFGVGAAEQPAFALPMLAAWSVALTTAAPFAIGRALAISQEY